MSESTKLLLPLAITSVLMYISLFFGNKIAGIGLLIWVLTVAWSVKKTILADVTIGSLIENNDERVKEDWNNKNFGTAGLRFIAIPMCGVGLVTIIMMILFLFIS